jgi:hypothetical protein
MKKHPALWIALYALVIWPHLLVAYVLLLRLPESFAGALLTYVGGLALGPLGFFFWHRRGAGAGHSRGGARRFNPTTGR